MTDETVSNRAFKPFKKHVEHAKDWCPEFPFPDKARPKRLHPTPTTFASPARRIFVNRESLRGLGEFIHRYRLARKTELAALTHNIQFAHPLPSSPTNNMGSIATVAFPTGYNQQPIFPFLVKGSSALDATVWKLPTPTSSSFGTAWEDAKDQVCTIFNISSETGAQKTFKAGIISLLAEKDSVLIKVGLSLHSASIPL